MVRFGMQATISPPRDSRKMQPAFARIYADAVQGWLWRIVFKRSTKQQCYSPKVQGFLVGGGAGKIWRSHDMKLCLARCNRVVCIFWVNCFERLFFAASSSTLWTTKLLPRFPAPRSILVTFLLPSSSENGVCIRLVSIIFTRAPY